MSTRRAPTLQQITIRTNGSDQTVDVCFTVGPFAIHLPIGPCVGYRVTHVQSGMAFPFYFPSKSEARRFATAAKPLTDWDALTQPALTSVVAHLKELAAKCRGAPTAGPKGSLPAAVGAAP